MPSKKNPLIKVKVSETGLSRPDTKSGKLQRACLELLREHERNGELPTNGRFLFYELEQRGVIPKHYDHIEHEPSHDITLALIHLRKRGVIPWDWLADESRNPHDWSYYASARAGVEAAAEHVRIDCWGGEDPPLIICESKATAGVLRRLAANYLCPIAGHRRTVRRFPRHQDRALTGGQRSPGSLYRRSRARWSR
jgi:hypothetical protein